MSTNEEHAKRAADKILELELGLFGTFGHETHFRDQVLVTSVIEAEYKDVMKELEELRGDNEDRDRWEMGEPCS